MASSTESVDCVGASNGSITHTHALEEEETFTVHEGDPDSAMFDKVIGHIQEVVMEDRFSELQQDFLDKHYHHFEDVEENKLIYTEIHNQYTALIERHLEVELNKRIPSFNMRHFMEILIAHKDEVPDEIFETLVSFTDFMAFKDMFLAHKADKEGLGPDLNGLLVTTTAQLHR